MVLAVVCNLNTTDKSDAFMQHFSNSSVFEVLLWVMSASLMSIS